MVIDKLKELRIHTVSTLESFQITILETKSTMGAIFISIKWIIGKLHVQLSQGITSLDRR